MDEARVREIAQKVVFESSNSAQYNVTPMGYHTHNGLDSLHIKEVDLIHNDKLHTGITAENEDTLYTINIGVANPTSISIFGFARNNLAGSAIKKTVFSGNAQLGNCYKQTTMTGEPEQMSIVQTCSGTYFDSTSGAWVPSVFTNADYIAIADFNNPTTIAYIQVYSYNNTSITFRIFATTDWRISANLIIT